MLNKRKKAMAFFLAIAVFIIGFIKVNTEITKTLGESNTSSIKINCTDNPFILKIDLKKYEIELSRNVLIGFKEKVQNLIN